MNYVRRLLLYFLGLFIIAVGINLAVKSALGISPVSALTVPLSQISGISLGTVTVIVYAFFVLLQIIILGRQFRAKLLLQSPFSIAFGLFLNYTSSLFDWINLANYLQQMIMLLLSIVVCSIGAALYITMDIVPNAPEGLTLAICKRFDIPFSQVKLISDCIFVSVGIALCLLFLGKVTAIREGTVIAALLTGKMIGFFLKIGEKPLEKLLLAK